MNTPRTGNFLMFTAGVSELMVDVTPIHNVRLMCERGSSFVLWDLIYAQAILFRLSCSVRTLLFSKMAEVDKKMKCALLRGCINCIVSGTLVKRLTLTPLVLCKELRRLQPAFFLFIFILALASK